MTGFHNLWGRLRCLNWSGNRLGHRGRFGCIGDLPSAGSLRGNGPRTLLNHAVQRSGVQAGCVDGRAAATAHKVAMAVARIPTVGRIATPVAPILFATAVFAAATVETEGCQYAPHPSDNARLPRGPAVGVEEFAGGDAWSTGIDSAWRTGRSTGRTSRSTARPSDGETRFASGKPAGTADRKQKNEVFHRCIPLFCGAHLIRRRTLVRLNMRANSRSWFREGLSAAEAAQSRKSSKSAPMNGSAADVAAFCLERPTECPTSSASFSGSRYFGSRPAH